MPASPAVLPPPSDLVVPVSRSIALAEQVEAAQAALQANPSGSDECEAARRLLADSIGLVTAISPSRVKEDDVKAVCRLVETILRAGWVDAPAEPEIAEAAEQMYKQGWNKVLAALLIAPAWQVNSAPTFAKAPLFLWPTLAASCFRQPPAFVALGQADAAARQYARRLGELVAAAEVNPGSQAVRAAAAACESAGGFGILRASSIPLHEVLSLRGRLRAALSRVSISEGIVPVSREGRCLRLGVVVRNLSDDPQTRMARPWFETLDARRFEVHVFVCEDADPEIEAELAAKRFVRKSLSGDTEAQAMLIRDEALDCALFFTRATDPSDPVSRILDHRVAALQVAIEESGGTSGLSQADAAFVENSDDIAARSAFFTERVLAVPTTGVRFPSLVGANAPLRSWTRDSLGLSADEVLFSSAAPFSKISPEWADRACQILKEVPGSKLLIHSNAPEDSGQLNLSRVCSTLTPAMARHEIAAARLIISNEALCGLREVSELLRVSDIHLDTFPSTDFEGSALALESGVPVVTGKPMRGFDPRTSDALLKLGLPDCIACDAGSLVDAAVLLGRDPKRREAIRSALRPALATENTFCDPIIFSDSISALLEKAFDLVFQGTFGDWGARRPPIALDPVADPESVLTEASIFIESGLYAEATNSLRSILACDPGRAGARVMYYNGMILGDSGNRASLGVEAAAERGVGGATTWFQLSKIRSGQGRKMEAIGALKRSLDLDPNNIEAWSFMKMLAEARGGSALSREIDGIIAAIRGNSENAAILPATRKSLYFSPVGKGGKEILSRILAAFPKDKFDFLIIAYDDTDFSDLGDAIKVIRDRGQKWSLTKKHLTPDVVANYEYVFIWDDDIEPNNFNAEVYLDILRRNQLDIAQPSLTADSHSFHPITVSHATPVGRQTNFVEIMCPAYSAKIWPSIYAYIEPEINEFGWGYDLIPIGRKGIVDCMSVRHTRPGQSGRAGAEAQYLAWCRKHNITRPSFVDIRSLS